MIRSILVACLAASLLAACSGPPLVLRQAQDDRALPVAQGVRVGPAATSPIEHVIVLVQQNRSFDSLFKGFPGADWASKGKTHDGKEVRLKPITFETTGKYGLGLTLPEDLTTFKTEYRRGHMNGFDLIRFGADGNGPPAKLYPYAYVVGSETKPYWNLAKSYALADHLFETEQVGSYASNLVMVAASTAINDTYVTGVTNAGGCDAPLNTHSILAGGRFGPPPCFDWKTMASLLDAKGVAWKYYSLLCAGRDADPGCLWNAFESIKPVRDGRDWKRNVSTPDTNIFDDLKKPAFPAVAWVTPTLANSDDSASGSKGGPQWVNSIVSAVKQSRYWQHTAVVVVWSDWGGYYDHVTPPLRTSIAYGFRVPMIVVSPYAKRGYVSHTEYDLTSILKFIEDNWNLGNLGKFDESANSIADMFAF